MSAKRKVTAGAAIFEKLGKLDVEYVFVNSGTDFPPIIEGYVNAKADGRRVPTPIVVPHEHAAVSMAHGYYQISGKAQAVMLHTNVGLSNGVTGLINAWCDQVPMIVMSGRTPTTEQGRFGARTVPIGWGQEMFDQTGMVREVTKWDYELRFPEQISDLIDRGWAIANSTPKGPVYLSLPREVLCEEIGDEDVGSTAKMQPVVSSFAPGIMEAAAKALSEATSPLIIAQRGTGDASTMEAFRRFVNSRAIPVCHYWSNQISLAISDPMQIGADPSELLAKADVVLVINSLAPWFPDKMALAANAKVIQVGPDPLFSRTPVRNFPSDYSLAGETAATLMALINAVESLPRNEMQIETRRSAIAEIAKANRDRVNERAKQGNGSPMTKEWVAHCLGKAIKGKKVSVFHELGCPLQSLDLEDHNSYFQEPHSGGLGWGFPAALGAQLADPDRLVFATIGDGSYMFSNPSACHLVAEALSLPVVVVVLNNEEWGAVRASAESLYPDGKAKVANEVPLTSLRPSPDFTKTAEASRAYTETVLHGGDLPAALDRAIKVATEERRQVLLNVAIARETF